MATNVRNILLEVVGRGDDAKQTLLELAQSVRDLPDRKRLEVEAQTEEAQRKIREMIATLKAVDRAKATPEVNVAITKALLELEGFEGQLDDLDGRRVTAHLEVEAQRAQIQRALAQATDLLAAVGGRQDAITVQFDLKIAEAESNLARIRAEIAALPEERTVEIDARAQGLDAELARAEAKLTAFVAQREERVIRFTAETARAEANIARLRAAEAALPDRHEIDIEVNQSIIGNLEKVNGGITGVIRNLDRAVPQARQFGEEFSNATFRASAGFLSFGGALGPVFAVVAALAVVVGVSLVGALAALVASFAAAAAGAVALGVALAGAFGPAVALAVAVASRLAKVTAALKAEDAAAEQVGTKAAQGSQAATAAAERHEAAVTSLRDAQAALGRAGAQAYREMEDAAEAASDAIRGIADAELNLDSARLSIEEAELALREYTETLQDAGTLSRDFQKFTDVALDFDPGAINQAVVGAGGTEADAVRLQRLILNIREARLREANAVDAVSDAERNRTRTLETHNAFVRDGIAASAGYQAALRGVRDAQRQVNTAMQDPAPIAATAKAAFLVGQLTDKERELLRAIKEVRRELRGAFSGATDAVFGGLIRMLRRVPQLVNPLRGAFTQLGRDIAASLDIFGEELIRPEWISAIRRFIEAGGRISRVFTRDLFVPFLRIVRDLALAALPRLESLLRRAGRAMQSLSGQAGPTRLRDIVNAVVDNLESWLALTGQLARVFINFVRIGASEGRSFVDTMTEGARKLADWLATARGRNTVRDFLHDAVEASKTFLKNVGLLTLALLQFVSDVSPALTKVFGLLSRFLGLLDKIDFKGNPALAFFQIGDAIDALRGKPDAAAAALDRLRAAQDRLSDAQHRGEEAIRDFMDARRQATRELSDMASAASGAQLDQRRARLEVRDAKKRLALLRQEGASADDIERAEIDLADARLRLRDATRTAARAVQDNNAAQADGIKGTDVYRDALDRMKGALADTATEMRKVAVAQREAAEARSPDLSPWDKIKAKASDVAGSVSGTFSRLWQRIPIGLRTGIADIATILATRGAALPGIIARWGPRLLSAASEAAGNIAAGIRNNAENIRGAVGGLITGGIVRVREFFGRAFEVGSDLGEKIVNGVGAGLSALGEVGRDILNGLIDLFNGAIGLINGAIPNKVKLRGLPDINLPDNPIGAKIPHLAGGGVVTSATTAVIGEQRGVREAVLPLTRRIMRQLAAAITSQMSSFAVAPILAGGGRGALSPSPVAAGAGGMSFPDAVFKIEAPAGSYPDARTTMSNIESLVSHLGGDPNAG